MSDYTPTSDEVREAYVDRKDFEDQVAGVDRRGDSASGGEFDRWLAKHDAETLRTAAVEVYALHEAMQARADLWEGGR